MQAGGSLKADQSTDYRYDPKNHDKCPVGPGTAPLWPALDSCVGRGCDLASRGHGPCWFAPPGAGVPAKSAPLRQALSERARQEAAYSHA